VLSKIAVYHKEWVRMALRLGCGDYSEDIVQEMYIKLVKYSNYDKCISKYNGSIETVNKFYIYRTLHSISMTYFIEKNRVTKLDDSCLYSIEDKIETEKNKAQAILSNKIEAEINSWHWYDRGIFNYYRNKKISYRQIQAETKIHWTSIFRVIKKCKLKLKSKIGEDYIDYINEDYELIKDK